MNGITIFMTIMVAVIIVGFFGALFGAWLTENDMKNAHLLGKPYKLGLHASGKIRFKLTKVE
jgi:hypothetical protein